MSDVEVSRRGFLRWLSFSGAGVAASTLLADPAGASAPDLTVFVNGRLIDGTGAPTRSDAVIVVARDKIVAVAQGRGVPRPAGARTVDLAGRYVIPGLWDMHAHNIVDEAIFPPLYLANGVTGIREMRGGPEVRATRARIERGELLGPRVVAAGPIVDGPATFLGPEDIIVHDRREVIATVRQIKRDGGDFVKVYSHLTPELYQDVADATRREHIPVSRGTSRTWCRPRTCPGRGSTPWSTCSASRSPCPANGTRSTRSSRRRRWWTRSPTTTSCASWTGRPARATTRRGRRRSTAC
ncbi:hypothetical protein ACFQX7_37060 [Luedemannella flava]